MEHRKPYMYLAGVENGFYMVNRLAVLNQVHTEPKFQKFHS